MKLRPALFLLPLMFIVTVCNDTEGPVDPADPIKPAPEGAQYVEGSIDKSLNLEGAQVLTLFDSTEVKDGKFKLLSSKDFPSQLFITDETGEKMLAVVNTTPGETDY